MKSTFYKIYLVLILTSLLYPISVSAQQIDIAVFFKDTRNVSGDLIESMKHEIYSTLQKIEDLRVYDFYHWVDVLDGEFATMVSQCKSVVCIYQMATALGVKRILVIDVYKKIPGFRIHMDYVNLIDGIETKGFATVSWAGGPGQLKDLIPPLVKKAILGKKIESLSGIIEIVEFTPGAIIYLDNKEYGRTPLSKIENVPIGKHEIRIAKMGYYPKKIDIIVREGKTVRIDATLEVVETETWYYRNRWLIWSTVGIIAAGGGGYLLYKITHPPKGRLVIEGSLP